MPRFNVALNRVKKSLRRYPLRWSAGVLLLLLILYKEYAKKALTDQSKKTESESGAIKGSDQSTIQLDLGDPFMGLQELNNLDKIWGPGIEEYRAKHDIIIANGMDFRASRRFPTRWAILRLTVDQQTRGNDGYGISDPYDGQLKPAWGALLSTYSPTAEDIQNTANAVEQHYTGGNASSSLFGDILSSLKTFVSAAGAAVTKDYGKLGGIVKNAVAGSGTPDAFQPARALSKDEQVILAYLRGRIVDVVVDTPTTDRLRRMTAQEALSGGGVSVLAGFHALGGPTDFATRELSPLALSPQTRALSVHGLCLKAALIARRVPIVGTSIEEFPYRSGAGEIDADSMGDL